jgi:hypothetical protein
MDKHLVRKFGEVFTPLPLVNEMLDKLPTNLWSNPNLKWIDNSCGNGNFLLEIKNRLLKNFSEEHILTNMLYGVEIQQKNCIEAIGRIGKFNLVCGDALKFDYWGGMKFDVVVGNPPYQNNLYKQFTELALNLSSKYVLFVIPSTFMIQVSGNKFKSTIINSNLISINFLPNNFFKGADVSTLYFLWSKEDSETVVINNTVKVKDRSLIFDCYDQCEISILLKIKDHDNIPMYKGKNETLEFNNPQQKNFLSEYKTEEHTHKLLSRLCGGDVKYLWTSKIKENTNQSYLVFPRGTASWNNVNRLKDISRDIVFSTYVHSGTLLSTALIGILVKNEEEANILCWYLMRSKMIRWLFIRFNLPFSELTAGILKRIPAIPLDGSIKTDTDLYEYFNFTEDEVSLIESSVKS